MRPVRSRLTSREWEVLDLLCERKTTDTIATELFLSPETVRSHVKAIYRKLGVNSRDAAIDAAADLRQVH
jgi:DNA-binding NarL/FixJ family response regulator